MTDAAIHRVPMDMHDLPLRLVGRHGLTPSRGKG